ncbi:MAG: nitrilase-related carbon-nitrogen hydrolase [Thermoplasmata archaeon]
MEADLSPSPAPPYRIALAQMRCATDPAENLRVARRFVGSAARQGASLCVLPELFSNRYCGQFEDVPAFLEGVPDSSRILETLTADARRRRLAILAPFMEKTDSGAVYNSVVLIDSEGQARGKYRKIHIPAAEGYREDRYFRPGDLGYCVAQLGSLRIGLAICWDQWFPEVSRILALKGAQLIIYPSAIGSEVVAPDFDSHPDWEFVMRAQAIMNRVFIAAVNRVGQEERIRFYGGSFVADPWGKVVRRAGPTAPRLLVADLDLSQAAKANSFFGFMDTRAPSTYGELQAHAVTPAPS